MLVTELLGNYLATLIMRQLCGGKALAYFSQDLISGLLRA